MKKFFFDTLIVLIALAIFVVACTFFLAPNDIADCSTPGIYQSSISKCQKVDAIISISGGNTAARTNEAVRLYQQGWAEKVIFSGAAADVSSPSNANVMKSQAIEQGVPAANILIDEDAKNTNQNAELTAKIYYRQQIQKNYFDDQRISPTARIFGIFASALRNGRRNHQRTSAK